MKEERKDSLAARIKMFVFSTIFQYRDIEGEIRNVLLTLIL